VQTLSSRDDLVIRHLGLVQAIASRYANRGESVDDLRQVGYIGLLKAADRFDSERGLAFTTYGYAKIVGEIRRHFRDKCWAIRVPRKLQELTYAVERLKNALPESPDITTAEIASRLSESEEAVRRAGDLSSVYRPLSLDAVLNHGGEPVTFLEIVGKVDPAIERAEARNDIAAACTTLSKHERAIVRLRFFEEMTQAAIGMILGKSQMYVSRVEKRALRKLRGYNGFMAGDRALDCVAI
jgi:RNA polymerase sigma-B factor